MAEPAPNLWFPDPPDSQKRTAPKPLETEKVPLVIGVTGHREVRPEDEEDLLRASEKVLSKLKARRSPETPIVLLSPLAEGADRIVARAALALGIHLVVPLPMPQEEYERDFPQTVGEFHDFLENAQDVFHLPFAQGNSPANIAQPAHRDEQYKAVGQYIARHCEQLIALWDGEGLEDEQGCGTAAVVRYKKAGVDQLVQYGSCDAPGPFASGRNLLEPSECGPVHQIWTRRRGRELSKGILFAVETHYPDAFGSPKHAERYYEAIFKRIDRFNDDVASADPEFRAFIYKQRESLIPAKAKVELAAQEDALQKRFAVADALAIRLQSQLKKTQIWIHRWVFLGSVFFGMFAHLYHGIVSSLEPRRWATVPAYLLLGAVLGAYYEAYRLYRKSKREDCQDNYQDYRALAEGLRVQFFWRLAGIDESVVDHYFGKHRTELDWIRNAIRNWATTTKREKSPENRLRIVWEYWVNDQHKYFHSRRDRHKHERLEKWVRWLLYSAAGLGLFLLGTYVLGAVLAWNFGIEGVLKLVEMESLRDGIVFLAGTALVGAGLLHHYKEVMAYGEHDKQYRRMSIMFGSAARLLDEAIDRKRDDKARMLLRDTGVNALEENGDWVMLHRERPLEIPAAG